MKYDSHYTGKAGEFRVLSELLLRGHNCSVMAIDDGMDIVLDNGKTIQVKTSRSPRTDREAYSVSFTSTQYRHGIKSKATRGIVADFLVVWLVGNNSFFIIPANKIINTMCISFSNKSKWNKYKDNWDMLKEGGK